MLLLAELTSAMGLRGIIWNVDTLDWEYAATNPSLVLSNFQAYLAYMGSAGIIQLQHDIINQSVNLVPQVNPRPAVIAGVSTTSEDTCRLTFAGAVVATFVVCMQCSLVGAAEHSLRNLVVWSRGVGVISCRIVRMRLCCITADHRHHPGGQSRPHVRVHGALCVGCDVHESPIVRVHEQGLPDLENGVVNPSGWLVSTVRLEHVVAV